MRKVQRLAAGLLALSLSIACAQAEILTIDIDRASYEEINTAYQQLKQARMEKLKETYAASYTPEPKSDIMFRGIPWGTTRSEVEQQIGLPSQYNTAYAYVRQGVVDDDIGLYTSYKKEKCLKLAGYSVKYTDISYAYPVVDGTLIRDTNLAVMYYAEYDLWDVGDPDEIVEDLTKKLVQLYGDYRNDGSGKRIWSDSANNEITLDSSATRVYVCYISGDAGRLTSEAAQARDDELAEQEELLRLQNQNNYDGL